MKKLVVALMVLTLTVTLLLGIAFAEETEPAWAYALLPLNSEDAGVGTIFYAKDYFALEGIINPVTTEPFTAEEIAAIVDGAAEGAEGYRFDLPEGAMLGMSVYGAAEDEQLFWYDAEAAAAIVSHADALVLNPDTGALTTAEGEEVALPMA